MKQNTIKMQFGRSMIEIIGVLTIMGMLGIVGMMSYNSINSSYTVNQITDGVKKLQTLVVSRQVRSAHDVKTFLKKANIRYADTDNVYVNEASGSRAPRLIKIYLKNVPENISEMLRSGSSLDLCSDTKAASMLKACSGDKCNEYKRCVLIETENDNPKNLTIMMRQSGKKF